MERTKRNKRKGNKIKQKRERNKEERKEGEGEGQLTERERSRDHEIGVFEGKRVKEKKKTNKAVKPSKNKQTSKP